MSVAKFKSAFLLTFGAENETRTRDPNLGKVVLYQLSYFRIFLKRDCKGTKFFQTSKLFCVNFWKNIKKYKKQGRNQSFPAHSFGYLISV